MGNLWIILNPLDFPAELNHLFLFGISGVDGIRRLAFWFFLLFKMWLGLRCWKDQRETRVLLINNIDYEMEELRVKESLC